MTTGGSPKRNGSEAAESGFVVDDGLTVLEFLGRTAPYVELSPGPPSLNLRKLLQPGLRSQVLHALEQVRKEGAARLDKSVLLPQSGLMRSAHLTVERIQGGGSNEIGWRILLSESEPPAEKARSAASADASAQRLTQRDATVEDTKRLFEQLLGDQDSAYEVTRQDLREALSRQETLTAEFEATNQELQITNAQLEAAAEALRESGVERERILEELQTERDFVTATLDTVGALIVVLDPEGHIVNFNRACEKTTGYEAEDVRGRPVWNLLLPEEAPAVKAVFSELRSEMLPNTSENHWVAKDGQTKLISWSNTVMLSPDREAVSYILATGVDITESRRLENELRQSEATAQALFENAVQGIIVVKPDGRIETANRAAQSLFGCGQQDLLGLSIERLLPERNRISHVKHRADFFAAPQQRRMGEHEELFARRTDGSEFPVEISLSHIDVQGARLAVAFITDITARRAADQELRKSREQLRALGAQLMTAQEEERRRVARDLHDDITQKISVLGMELSMLKRSAPPEARAHIQGLHEDTLELADDTRRLSHELHPSVLEHSGLVPALEQHCMEFAKGFGLNVKFIVGDLPSAPTIGMSTALYRIAQEAIRNAAKHGQAKNVWVRLTSLDGELRLSVIDDGRGFDVDNADSDGGIGLVSMAERARSVGGRFSIESEINAGTRIEARVPAEATDPQEALGPSDAT